MAITSVKKTTVVIALFLGWLFLIPVRQVWAESFFEIAVAGGERQLDIFRKEAPDDVDDASYIGLSLAAYRKTGEKSAWGGVIEVLKPIGRDSTVGSGRVLGFRPVNYLLDWNQWLTTELFMGAAQYNWIKNASGYYFGTNVRIRFGHQERYAVGLDYKYFQDLAHDGGPGGDQIIDGPSVAIQLHYRFAPDPYCPKR